MTLITAYAVLEKEMHFLRIHWDHLLELIAESPLIFSKRTHEAYERIMQEKVAQ